MVYDSVVGFTAWLLDLVTDAVLVSLYCAVVGWLMWLLFVVGLSV